MRVRDDDVRPYDPARAGDAEAAGGPGHAEDARPRPADARVRGQRRVGRGDACLRARDAGEGVDARDRVEQPSRRYALVDLAEDLRALHLLAQPHLPGHVERHSACDPHEGDAGGRAEHDPAERVDHPQRGQREQARPDRGPGHPAHALEQPGQEDGSAERDERRIGGLGPGEELRCGLRPQVGADDDSGERERPCDEPAPEAVEPARAITPAAIQVRSHRPTLQTASDRTQARMPRPWGRSSVG